MRNDTTTSKEKILKKIRKALLQKGEALPTNVDMETDVHVPEDGELVETFSGNFLKNNGKFTYCFNEYDFVDRFLAEAEASEWQGVLVLEPWLQSLFGGTEYPLLAKHTAVKQAGIGVTGCDALLARTGSVVVSSRGALSRTSSIFPPVHAVVAFRDQLHYDMANFLPAYTAGGNSAMPSMTVIISGPSRTADIEKTLVLGAHGPKEIHVFYIDQDKPL